MLSFEFEKPATGRQPDTLQVHLNREGLDALLAQLQFLVDGRTDHVHLMSEEWGGSQFTGAAAHPGNVPFHHVKILLR